MSTRAAISLAFLPRSLVTTTLGVRLEVEEEVKVELGSVAEAAAEFRCETTKICR